jgi:hypothetical protein
MKVGKKRILFEDFNEKLGTGYIFSDRQLRSRVHTKLVMIMGLKYKTLKYENTRISRDMGEHLDTRG